MSRIPRQWPRQEQPRTVKQPKPARYIQRLSPEMTEEQRQATIAANRRQYGLPDALPEAGTTVNVPIKTGLFGAQLNTKLDARLLEVNRRRRANYLPQLNRLADDRQWTAAGVDYTGRGLMRQADRDLGGLVAETEITGPIRQPNVQTRVLGTPDLTRGAQDPDFPSPETDEQWRERTDRQMRDAATKRAGVNAEALQQIRTGQDPVNVQRREEADIDRQIQDAAQQASHGETETLRQLGREKWEALSQLKKKKREHRQLTGRDFIVRPEEPGYVADSLGPRGATALPVDPNTQKHEMLVLRGQGMSARQAAHYAQLRESARRTGQEPPPLEGDWRAAAQQRQQASDEAEQLPLTGMDRWEMNRASVQAEAQAAGGKQARRVYARALANIDPQSLGLDDETANAVRQLQRHAAVTPGREQEVWRAVSQLVDKHVSDQVKRGKEQAAGQRQQQAEQEKRQAARQKRMMTRNAELLKEERYRQDQLRAQWGKIVEAMRTETTPPTEGSFEASYRRDTRRELDDVNAKIAKLEAERERLWQDAPAGLSGDEEQDMNDPRVRAAMEQAAAEFPDDEDARRRRFGELLEGGQ